MGNYTTCIDYEAINASKCSLIEFSSFASVAYGSNGVEVLKNMATNLNFLGAEHDNCFANSIKLVEDLEEKTKKVTQEVGNLGDGLEETLIAYRKSENDINSVTNKSKGINELLGKINSIYDVNCPTSVDANKIKWNMLEFKQQDVIDEQIKKQIEEMIKKTNATISQQANSIILEDESINKTGAIFGLKAMSLFPTAYGLSPAVLYLNSLARSNALSEKGIRTWAAQELKKQFPNMTAEEIDKAVNQYLSDNSNSKEDTSVIQNAESTNVEAVDTNQTQTSSSNQQQFRQESSSDSSQADSKPDTSNKPDSPDKPENSEKPEKPENPEKPEKPNKPENPETPSRPENPNKPENPETPNQPENPGDNVVEPENPPTDGNDSESNNPLPPSTNTDNNYSPGNNNNNYYPNNNNSSNNQSNNEPTIIPNPDDNNNSASTTPSAPDSDAGIIDNSGETLDVISIDKNKPSTSTSDGGNVVPTIIGVGVAGAAAAAGAKYIKNKKEQKDEFYSEESSNDSFSSLSQYQGNSSGEDLYNQTMEIPAKYKAGNVNKLVLDEAPDNIKIEESFSDFEEKEELE